MSLLPFQENLPSTGDVESGLDRNTQNLSTLCEVKKNFCLASVLLYFLRYLIKCKIVNFNQIF